MSLRPISERQFHAFMSAIGRPGDPWSDRDTPATRVSWTQATEFCIWLSANTGLSFSLPTEVEWSCSAPMNWPPRANRTKSRRRRFEFHLGLWEWCSDRFQDQLWRAGGRGSEEEVVTSALSIRRAVRRVVHGSENEQPIRDGLFPEFWFENVGFRVVGRW